MAYTLSNRLGTFDKSFKLTANAGAYTQVFRLRGQVVPDKNQAMTHFLVKQGPLRMLARAVTFGEAVDKRPLRRHFFVYNDSEDTLTFRSNAVPNHLRLRLLPKRLPPKQVGTWEVTYLPHARVLAGYQVDEVLIYVKEKDDISSVKCFVASTR